jgi:hypothetical protein
MDHVEGCLDGFLVGLGIGLCEPGLFRRAVDAGEVVKKFRCASYFSMYFISAGT